MWAKAELPRLSYFDQNLMGSLEENAALRPPGELASVSGLPLPTRTPGYTGKGAQLQNVSDPIPAARRQIPAGKAPLVQLRETLWQKQREKLRSEQPSRRQERERCLLRVLQNLLEQDLICKALPSYEASSSAQLLTEHIPRSAGNR